MTNLLIVSVPFIHIRASDDATLRLPILNRVRPPMDKPALRSVPA
jgi:hypothetical protein